MGRETTGSVPRSGGKVPANAQRRYLTFVFSDLSDSSKLASEMENEDLSALLDELRGAYLDVVARHGGTIARIQGDGMLAIFGYPEAREDSARRAVEAALELHETIRRIRVESGLAAYAPLGLHSGIHSGLALVSDGDLLRGQFDVVGEAPNIAWRLSDIALKDEILISEATLGPENQFFHTSERYFVPLRGRVESIAVRRILARAPVGNRYEASARRGLTPFVGREFELRALERGVRETIAGEARYIALVAPPGLGKTRLAEEFLQSASARECGIYRGYCEEHLGAEPLQPFLQMLRSLLGLNHAMSATGAADVVKNALTAIDPALEAHRAALLVALSLTTESAAGESRLQAAQVAIAGIRDLFWSLAAAGPIILLIDDWQWADRATRELLGAIQDGRRRRIFVLVTTRAFTGVDAATGRAQRLELAPLSDAEVARTITCLLPNVDPFVASSIQKHAGGNPLYIEELCHSAAFAQDVRGLSGARGSTAWLDTLIESRVARLSQAQADLVRVAAVIGNVVPVWLLETLTGCGEAHPLVRDLAEQDLVFPSAGAGTLRFKHGITREVIYAACGLQQRRATHLRIAEALRQRDSASGAEETYEALAYHYAAGGEMVEAARYAELAGDKAFAASSLDRALAQYRAALVALDALPASIENYRRWNSIAQRFGLVCVFDPSGDQLPLLRRAVELAAEHDDQAAVAQAEYWLGYVHYSMGALDLAIRHLERALAAGKGFSDTRLQLKIRATLGQARVSAGDYEGALTLLDEAIAVAHRRHARAGPAVGFSYTLACKAVVLGDRGEFAEAQACFDEALNAVRGAENEVEASVRGWRCAVYLWQGRWEDAVRCANDGLRVAERVKSHFMFASSRALGAVGSWSMHRSEESLQIMIDSTAWLEDGDRRLSISLNYGWLTEAMGASGRLQEMRHYAARALLRARRGERLGLAMTRRALARASAAQGEHQAAQHHLALAMAASRARASRHEIAVTQLCAAEIAAGGGQRSAAIPLLDEAEAAFGEMQMAWHLASARALRATL